MGATALWIVIALVGVWGLDRVLVWMEARRWINYRRSKGAWRGAAYHALELQTVFEPGMEHLQQVQVKDEEEEDEAGDPPVEESDPPTE